jgi:hypothetical protein
MKTAPRRILRLALAASAVGAVGAGLAYATVPDGAGLIHACYGNRDGNLRVVDTYSGQACNARETALDWNRHGPAGPAGPPGPSDAFATSGLVHLEGYGARATVASIAVPAGSYVVTAAVNGYADADPDGDGGVVASCFAPGGSITRIRFVPYPDIRHTPLVGWVTRTSPGPIAVTCRLFDDDGSAYVQSDLAAIKVVTITTPYPNEQ